MRSEHGGPILQELAVRTVAMTLSDMRRHGRVWSTRMIGYDLGFTGILPSIPLSSDVPLVLLFKLALCSPQLL